MVSNGLFGLARPSPLIFFPKFQECNGESDSLYRLPNTSEDNKYVCEVDVLTSYTCVQLQSIWLEAAEEAMGLELVMPVSTRLINVYNWLTHWAR